MRNGIYSKTLLVTWFISAGGMYSSCFEISVTQHDVLRDLAVILSNRESINERRRLVMPKREKGLPKEWLRHKHKPFEAQIVSIHTGIYNI
jgi:ribosomal protein S8